MALIIPNPDAEKLADELEEIAKHCANLPLFDDRRAEEILGCDDNGLAR